MRNGGDQEKTLGRTIDPSLGLVRGDLVFWKGHIGIMTDPDTLLHANMHHAMTATEPLAEALIRGRSWPSGDPLCPSLIRGAISISRTSDGVTITAVRMKNRPQSPPSQSTSSPDDAASVVRPAVPIDASSAYCVAV